MDRILFGDNQFFGINHLSEEKARSQALRFKDTRAIIDIIDYINEIGIKTFMPTTHERISEICDHIRDNRERYKDFQIYPCMPYAHKYANAVTELGIIGTLNKYVPNNKIKTIAKGGISLAKQDLVGIMKLLIDAEMSMFKGIRTGVIFLQNVITDLILGLGFNQIFVEFARYVKSKYDAEPGFITMNLPLLLGVLEKNGIENPIICASLNKINFRMSGGKDLYEKILDRKRVKFIAMQIFAAGAISPQKAIKFVCNTKGINSILFGASTKSHILQNKKWIEYESAN